MIAIDTSILVCAHRKDAEHHEAAAEWVRSLAQGRATWAIPWPCLHEFLSIVTNPQIFVPPSTAEQAFDQIEAWLEAPTLVTLAESDRHLGELRALVAAGHSVGPRVHEARVAAICLEHGVRELWTADRDSNRFPGLHTVNPLIGSPPIG